MIDDKTSKQAGGGPIPEMAPQTRQRGKPELRPEIQPEIAPEIRPEGDRYRRSRLKCGPFRKSLRK